MENKLLRKQNYNKRKNKSKSSWVVPSAHTIPSVNQMFPKKSK